MANQFKDNMSQAWTLALTLRKVRTIRDERLGVDLLNPQDYLRVMTSLTDRLAFVWCLCEPQARELEVDVDEFEERLYGGSFAADASDAFIKECSDFTRRLGQEVLARIAEKQVESMEAARVCTEEQLSSGQLDADLEAAKQEMLEMTQITGATSSS